MRQATTADLKVRFGRRLRALRTDADLSQERLADLAGLHRALIGHIERGEREVGVTKVWALAKALGVEPGRLFD